MVNDNERMIMDMNELVEEPEFKPVFKMEQYGYNCKNSRSLKERSIVLSVVYSKNPFDEAKLKGIQYVGYQRNSDDDNSWVLFRVDNITMTCIAGRHNFVVYGSYVNGIKNPPTMNEIYYRHNDFVVVDDDSIIEPIVSKANKIACQL